MTANDLSTGTPPRHANIQWLTDFICHLRDDLAAEQASAIVPLDRLPLDRLPLDSQIHRWVQDHFYPGLLHLAWEEAVHSLLSRMQRTSTAADFAISALAQLRRATRASQLWEL